MIFKSLHESAEKNELLLVDGGFCHWHLRRDGQLTIREIISTRPGAGSLMLERLRHIVGATSLFAKCPAELPANGWYAKKGFQKEAESTTRNGKTNIHWRLDLLQQTRRPNINDIELIYCAAGNLQFAEMAIDAGLALWRSIAEHNIFPPLFCRSKLEESRF